MKIKRQGHAEPMVSDQPLPTILPAQATCGASTNTDVIRNVLAFKVSNRFFMEPSMPYA
jgi:hypothetical protein